MNILLAVIFVLPALIYLGVWWRARPGVEPGRPVLQTSAGAHPREPIRATRIDAVGIDAVGIDAAGIGSQAGWLLFGLLAHALSIALAMYGYNLGGIVADTAHEPTLRYGFAYALSVTMWLGVALLWAESLRIRVEALLILVMPVAALASLLPMLYRGVDLSPLLRQPLFVPHLLVGTLAYGVLLMAALHAALMMAVERTLHAPTRRADGLFARWLDQLPPLLALERILFLLLRAGFVLLTLTTFSGVLFSEQVFGAPMRLDHKTVFTLIAWLMFGVLLFGRSRWGWRGRTALRLTLSGFVVLMLAYVGSHFVREVILHRI